MSVGTEGSGPNPRTYSRAEYAALEAENARLNDLISAARRVTGAVIEERDALRAELAEVKGREAVAEVVHCNEATGHFNLLGMRRLQAGAKLYTTPPAATSEAQGHTSEAAPGVAGLVKALEATLKLGRGTSGRIILESEDEEALRAALSTWRQAQEGKP